MTELLETGTMTVFALSPQIAMLALAALLLSAFAVRARPLAFRQMRPRVTHATTAPTSSLPAPQSLDITSQMDRLFAIISDCERLATHAARCHATARAELDQADYHLATLVDSDPLLRRISTRARQATLPGSRKDAPARHALRLAA